MDKAQQRAKLRDKWSCLIEDCQNSPLTVLKFARQNKITESCLYYWSKRLGIPLKNKLQPDINFIELNSIFPKAKITEVYSVEMHVNRLIIKTEASWIRIIELVREFA